MASTKYTIEWIILVDYVNDTPRRMGVYEGDAYFDFLESFMKEGGEGATRVEIHFASTPKELSDALQRFPENILCQPVCYPYS